MTSTPARATMPAVLNRGSVATGLAKWACWKALRWSWMGFQLRGMVRRKLTRAKE